MQNSFKNLKNYKVLSDIHILILNPFFYPKQGFSAMAKYVFKKANITNNLT